ncbi:single-stranded DNA-binding protein [Leifsonia shinshuensis]|uniref:single-stranded DNA-binding protein n=1 Tax=Leifsonia shinshuensis TaxID=150026 RepID=UPI001F50E94F|nr:single-stranded DNA-binding protein [Leifsonia shinshuensis]MCI0155313.1 single-stranded DNA-binding protein [Leifsonia shinshuensis]
MADPVAVRGVVATRPRHVIPQVGAAVTTFRLVTGPRLEADADADGPPDAQDNWYTVTATHRLAVSVAACVARGDPVVVAGRLRVRDWAGEPEGVTAEIDADAIGHDLAWGRSVFTRRIDGATPVAHREVRGVPTGTEP